MATGKPSVFLDFEIVGDKMGVQHMLNSVDSALSPVGLGAFLYGAVGPWVQQRAQERFAKEGDDVSGKWAPLQQATMEIREAGPWPVSGAGPINRRTGDLEAYVTQGGFDVMAAPAVSTLVYPKKVTMSKALKQKMETAQKGRRSPSTVPRPVLGLNERDLLQVMTMLAFFVQNGGKVRA